jgi:hypothetical protein
MLPNARQGGLAAIGARQRKRHQCAGNKKSAVSLIHLSSFCLVVHIVSRKRAFCRETDLLEPEFVVFDSCGFILARIK